MNRKKYTITLISVAVVTLAGGALYVNWNSKGSRRSVEDAPKTTSVDTSPADENSDTYKQYSAMKGETYDRNFIANMIAHHQGAVDMAKLAQANAKHTELQAMADNIVLVQEKEIADLLSWQSAWGYPSTSAANMQDHSAMGMMDSTASMMAVLEGKSGDAFDKAFLEQMIKHHQSAIDMAAPGKDNALRQEIKDVSASIVSAQSKEITQMKTWQSEWGYNN